MSTADFPGAVAWLLGRPGCSDVKVAGPRVEALEEGGSRLTLTLDMRGLLVPVVAPFYKRLTNRYMTIEAQGMKRAAESV